MNTPVPLLRPPGAGDVEKIYELVAQYTETGNLLPRTKDDISAHLNQFVVAEHRGVVVACAALEQFTGELGEVRSLVVEHPLRGTGLGARLVTHLCDRAAQLGMSRVMALTYVPDFFHKLGFVTVSKDSLPEKVWGICVRCYKFHNCDEIAVLKHLSRMDPSRSVT